jgi:hypothetical protein
VTGARVYCRRDSNDLYVEGHGALIGLDGEVFVAPTSVLEPAGIAHLRRALRRYGGDYVELSASDDHLEDFGRAKRYAEDAERRPVFLRWNGTDLSAEFFLRAPPATTADQVEAASTAAALRFRGHLIQPLDWSQVKSAAFGFLEFALPTHGRTAGDVLHDGTEILKLMEATLAGDLDAAMTAALIRGGSASVLLGLYESHWLEAKRAPYRLDEPGQQFELARDVAAMSNANGGLIVLGAKTKKDTFGDKIIQINGCTPGAVSPQAYRNIINRQLYPRLSSIRVTVVPHKEHEIALIEVGQEPSERQPILVKSAPDSRRAQGLGITWPIRSDDTTTAPPVEQIHALLRAGHVSLSRGWAPEEPPDARAKSQHSTFQSS